MIRNLKVLGLAFMAILALSAVVASAASAQQGKLTSESGDAVTLTAEETSVPFTETNFFRAFGSTIECEEAFYTGHEVNTTAPSKKPVPSGATEVTITPTYEGCHVIGSRQATVIMNTCDFEFYDLTTVSPPVAGKYNVDARLDCGHAGRIEVRVFTNTPPNPHGSELCKLTMSDTFETGNGIKHPVNQSITGATITNTLSEDLDLAGVFTGIHVARHGLCLLDGKGSTTNVAEYGIDVTVEGEEGLEGITVSD